MSIEIQRPGNIVRVEFDATARAARAKYDEWMAQPECKVLINALEAELRKLPPEVLEADTERLINAFAWASPMRDIEGTKQMLQRYVVSRPT
jgi:hypothetical protein